MLIISKFKDYYDFLQGIIGRDENLILDRTSHTFTDFDYARLNEWQTINPCLVTLLIGTKYFKYIIYKNKVYKNEDEIDFYTKIGKSFYKKNVKYSTMLNKFGKIVEKPLPELGEGELIKGNENKVFVKKPEDNPFIFVEVFDLGNDYNSGRGNMPNLEMLKFNKILTPKEVWMIIYDELCKKKEDVEPVKLSNDEKIKAKGFDKKTSFRNIK